MPRATRFESVAPVSAVISDRKDNNTNDNDDDDNDNNDDDDDNDNDNTKFRRRRRMPASAYALGLVLFFCILSPTSAALDTARQDGWGLSASLAPQRV